MRSAEPVSRSVDNFSGRRSSGLRRPADAGVWPGARATGRLRTGSRKQLISSDRRESAACAAVVGTYEQLGGGRRRSAEDGEEGASPARSGAGLVGELSERASRLGIESAGTGLHWTVRSLLAPGALVELVVEVVELLVELPVEALALAETMRASGRFGRRLDNAQSHDSASVATPFFCYFLVFLCG